jgi:phosphocarrier protein FPr
VSVSLDSSPEVGSPVVEGIAIGHAIVWASDPAPRHVAGTIAEEHTRIVRACDRATRDVATLVRMLPSSEAELFEPELAILGELEPLLIGRVDAGATAEEAVNAATSPVSTDLLIDARARLLDALADHKRSVEALLDGRSGDCVFVTETLTPSVVASLPGRVVGIVAALDDGDRAGVGFASHAAILARGRDIPLAFVPPRVVRAIANDDTIVVDTTVSPAHVWVAPTDAFVVEQRARRETWLRTRAAEEASVTGPLTHLGLEVHVNVGSLYERIPASAEGVGLLRTELVFSGRESAPSEREQFAALRAVGVALDRAPLVARLFDAGGDKPLSWLRAPDDSSMARGIELLLMHPALLDAQLRAMVRASAHADVRTLVPLASSAADIENVRARTQGKLPVGAMIETPTAVDRVDEIAAVSDFICIGTNDLFAMVTGQDRAASMLSIDVRALRMVERVIVTAHARKRKVSVCGEIAGDAHSAQILIGLGVDAISVATTSFAKLKRALSTTTLDACRASARAALGG